MFLLLEKINEPHLFSRLWQRFQEAKKLKDSKLLGGEMNSYASLSDVLEKN